MFTHLRNDLYCVEWVVKLYYTIRITIKINVFFMAQGPPSTDFCEN